MTNAPSNPYFAEVAEQWDEIRSGYFTEHMRDAAIDKAQLPPKAIVDVFDAEFLPQAIVSPNRQTMALTKARAYPTIAELSQPMYRLAGSRVNPKTNGAHRASGLPGTGIYTITLKKIADGEPWTMPATIDDPAILDEIGSAMKGRGLGN